MQYNIILYITRLVNRFWGRFFIFLKKNPLGGITPGGFFGNFGRVQGPHSPAPLHFDAAAAENMDTTITDGEKESHTLHGLIADTEKAVEESPSVKPRRHNKTKAESDRRFAVKPELPFISLRFCAR